MRNAASLPLTVQAPQGLGRVAPVVLRGSASPSYQDEQDGVGEPAPSRLAATYVVFALVATGLNVGAQYAAATVLRNWTTIAMPASVVFGTIVGFGSKYILDKYFIFEDRSRTPTDEVRKVLLYGAFGIGTTMLFWCCEFGAYYAIGGTSAKFAGAVVGLGLGYAAKFVLDRRYTFGATRQR